ncbi:hypothetical protein [Cohnella thailandensis]|uniref:Uncharacterized protein n=1 Tax=Cohnella thailandensis TaxID=557557 RepID=A0A841SZN1_9BACL|nr:hypothetical protein [Cohnella thailandensis]MBB6635290.1 hypothetical protein [Cohnella thailandensis]MBP1974667.1 hypothetical protein [Cohnella thailandensis]
MYRLPLGGTGGAGGTGGTGGIGGIGGIGNGGNSGNQVITNTPVIFCSIFKIIKGSVGYLYWRLVNEKLGFLKTIILKRLFYQRIESDFSLNEINDFTRIYNKALQNNGVITFDSKFPKYRFIDFIIKEKNYVVHGSNNKEIHLFETRRQTLYNGKYVDAVFASKDGIWSIFYAVLDRSKVVPNFRNGCFKARNNNRFYYFSLTQETWDKAPWTSGTVYFLSSELFEQTNIGRVYFDEWVCTQQIKPVLRLDVYIDDFEFLDKVATHKARESIIKTWLLYKIRTYL